MSQENVEIVRGIYAEWEQGNLAAAVEFFDPEIVFESFMPDSRERIVARGRHEVEAFTRDFLVETRDYRMIGEEFRAAGDDKGLCSGAPSNNRPTERRRDRRPGLLGLDVSGRQGCAIAL